MRDTMKYTVQRTAEILGIGTLYVYVLLRDNKLKGHKEKGRWLISGSSILARKKQLGERNGRN